MATARRAIKVLLGMALALGLGADAAAAAAKPASADVCGPWPLWQAYAAHFIQGDGRVVDFHAAHSTSEGQAYALFFALVANDRSRFDAVLKWTEANLAGGDLGANLPAWRWGQREDGSWGVLDPNAASDADLWLGYTLLEASRLWQEASYGELGQRLLALVVEQEVENLPGLGPMLLPGPEGFRPAEALWRLNPSYLPIQLLRALHRYDPKGPWGEMVLPAARLLRETAPHGLAPDWVAYQAGVGWRPDPDKGAEGSYDAIRVYLWLGMLDAAEPLRAPLLQALDGMTRRLRKNPVPPERGDTLTAEFQGSGPAGFSAALLPYLAAQDEAALLARQRQRVEEARRDRLLGEDPHYYDQNLALFGTGWLDGRFRFAAEGQLLPAWNTLCRKSRP